MAKERDIPNSLKTMYGLKTSCITYFFARNGNGAAALADTSDASSLGSTGCLLLLFSSLLPMFGGGLLW